jgi:tetratricopeptide (TPR) repeat protein
MTDDVERDAEQVAAEAEAEEASLAGLSSQIVARLEEVGLHTKQAVEEALAAGEEDFLDLPGVGPATLEAVQAWLDDEASGETVDAEPVEEEAPEEDREDADRGRIARDALALGKSYLAEGERELAQEHYEHALQVFEDLDEQPGIADSHEALAIAAVLRGAYGVARRHYERALALRRTLADQEGEQEVVRQLSLLEQLQLQ